MSEPMPGTDETMARARVDISSATIAAGRAVVVMPCVNPALAPVLDVTGFAGEGWYLTITDAFGTRLWSAWVGGRDE